MNKTQLLEGLFAIQNIMVENKEFLIGLDAKYGDGDLGISMENGFRAVSDYAANTPQADLGEILRGCSSAFNTAAPSTLGTLFSFWFMGMAKTLKGQEEATFPEVCQGILDGICLMMQRGKSAPGEKTILDAILPAATALKENCDKAPTQAFQAAYVAAKQGLEETRNMVGKHGRIAYYGEKTLGDTDAGATAGMLIFQALWQRYGVQ